MFNHKIVFVGFIISAALIYSSCGREKIEAGSPEEVLSFVREKGNSEAVLDFYTEDTVNLMKKYVKLTGMKSETSVDILSFIPEDSEYTITGKKIEGDNCFLNFIFTKHSSENGVGQVIVLKMVKDGKSWKIDRKDDFKKLIESYDRKGVEGYLNRIK